MITVLLVHTAIWTQFAASHAAGHLDFDLVKRIVPSATTTAASGVQYWSVDAYNLSDDDGSPPSEEFVIHATTLGEKYGLWEAPILVRRGFHLESAAQPSEQEKELAAVRADARHLAPNTDWLALRKDFVVPSLKPPVRTDWSNQLALRWEDDGGFWVGRKYFPLVHEPPTWNSLSSSWSNQ
jgi:hypothetical protein